MYFLKLILVTLTLFCISACGDESSSSSDSNSDKITKTNLGKVSISIQDMKDGKDSMNQEGCKMSLAYNNGMDIKVEAQVVFFELKHTKENYLQTGNSSSRSLNPGETDSASVFFPDFKCEQFFGIEVNRVKCSTEKGEDCSDKFTYIDSNAIKFSVNLYPPLK